MEQSRSLLCNSALDPQTKVQLVGVLSNLSVHALLDLSRKETSAVVQQSIARALAEISRQRLQAMRVDLHAREGLILEKCSDTQ